MGKMQHSAQSMHSNPIPQFRDLRRVPMCSQCNLPLKVMKQYRCAVVGAAQGVLTVAVTDWRDPSLIGTLTELTGHPIFPVWVKPSRMRLLILRTERWVLRKHEMLRWPHPLNLVQIHTIMAVSAYQTREKK
ncbi:MAG: hypothetical protein JOZ18_09615 [Chloroflexi bacterium]|nr:hypothetical protein [Chloroflexota bacterium]